MIDQLVSPKVTNEEQWSGEKHDGNRIAHVHGHLGLATCPVWIGITSGNWQNKGMCFPEAHVFSPKSWLKYLIIYAAWKSLIDTPCCGFLKQQYNLRPIDGH